MNTGTAEQEVNFPPPLRFLSSYATGSRVKHRSNSINLIKRKNERFTIGDKLNKSYLTTNDVS